MPVDIAPAEPDHPPEPGSPDGALAEELRLSGGWVVDLAISTDDARWGGSGPTIVEAVRSALEAGDPAGLDISEGRRLEVSVLLTNDERVQAANRDFRGKDAPTNVLAFAFLDQEDDVCAADAPVALGDVMISFDATEREACERRIRFEDHAFHLAVHGVLHLLGFDHIDDDEAKEMEDLETAILAAHGVADPHGDAPMGEGGS